MHSQETVARIPEALDLFLEAVEQGLTVRKACQRAQTSWRTVSLAIEKDTSFASRYAHARVHSALFYADKAQRAVESAKTTEEATIARVKADVYKWRARVADPRGYGDVKNVDLTGTVQVEHTDVTQLRDTLTARLAGIASRRKLLTATVRVLEAEDAEVVEPDIVA